jgi:hypothetical protein
MDNSLSSASTESESNEPGKKRNKNWCVGNIVMIICLSISFGVVMHHVRFLSFFCVEKNFVTVICFQAS